MIPRLPFILLLSALLVVSAWSCAPTVRMYGAPDDNEVIKNLPKDQALSFLQSLYVPATANTCRFEKDGVFRSREGQLLPGETPYTSLYFSGLGQGGGPPVRCVLSVRRTNEILCLWHPQPIAAHQGTDVTALLSMTSTALKVMGVTPMPMSELLKASQLPSWSEARESIR